MLFTCCNLTAFKKMNNLLEDYITLYEYCLKLFYELRSSKNNGNNFNSEYQ